MEGASEGCGDKDVNERRATYIHTYIHKIVGLIDCVTVTSRDV